jgi:hypothetical protein
MQSSFSRRAVVKAAYVAGISIPLVARRCARRLQHLFWAQRASRRLVQGLGAKARSVNSR